MIKFKILLLFLFVILNNYFIFGKPTNNFIMITVSNVSISDVIKYGGKNIKEIIHNGAIGLLNLRVVGKPKLEEIYLTINSSKRSICYECNEAYNIWEKPDGITDALTIYQQRIGRPPQGNIVQVQISKILKDNQKLIREPSIGILGEELKKNNITTCVIGNADIKGEEDIHNRNVALIAIDKDGVVKTGDVSDELLIQNLTSPYGLMTNLNEVIKKYKQVLTQNSFVVLDIGDTQRVRRYEEYIDDKIIEAEYRRIFNNLDRLLGVIIKDSKVGNKKIMVIFIPTMEEKPHPMGLCIIKSEDIKKGYLISGTTKRKGIISILDIAPTILNFFNINLPKEMDGKPIRAISAPKSNILFLDNYTNNIIKMDAYLRNIILYLFCGLLIISYWGIFLKYKENIFTFLILFCLILPITTSASALFNINISITIILLLILSLIPSLVLSLLKFDNSLKIFFISFFTFIIFSIDILTGNNLLASNTPFGYSYGIGVRFYGIGNFTMAALLGSSFVVVYYLLIKNLRYIAILFALFTTLLIGLPNFGANFGGFITSIFTFLFYFYFLSKSKINYKDVNLLFFTLGSNTHIHTFIERIYSGDMNYLIEIIKLKLFILIATFKHIHWNLLFATFILIPVIIYLLNNDKLIKFKKSDELLYLSSKALFLGGIIGSIVNDSGLAVPCIMWCYLFSIIMVKNK